MPKSQKFPAICLLLKENLERYPDGSKEKLELVSAFTAFQEAGFQESAFEDPESIEALDKILQQFLKKADTTEIEISAKANEGRSEKDAPAFEELLDAFNLREEIPLPNPDGKTIAIFGASLGMMRFRIKWVLQQLEKYPEIKDRPQIVFLSGHRAAFPSIEVEKEVLVKEIAAKISVTEPEASSIVDGAIAAAREIATKPEHLQAITPLMIMRKVNESALKSAPKPYDLEGLDAVDLSNYPAALDLLKTALSTGIYPSETTMAKVVAIEHGLDPKKALFPADGRGKEYRATTKDNAAALLKKIQNRECDPQVILVSNKPFCQRQHKDVLIYAENLETEIEGLNFEVCGSKHVDTRVNPATILDVLARDVYATNQLYKDRAKRSAAKEKAAEVPPASVAGAGSTASAVTARAPDGTRPPSH